MGKLKTDPLFLGLTRPAMVFGVSFLFFGLNMMISVSYFVVTSDFRIVLFAVFFHGAGMLLTKKEPLAIEILMVKLQKCNGGQNKTFYKGLHSYGVF